MSAAKKVLLGCLSLPILVIGSCAGKIYYNAAMYELPGEVLKSSSRPTRALDSAMEVAETLDSYVQPRFAILRDKNFGAIRIVFRKHAGIVQLKVDTPEEKNLIANINATNRDYAISLLHCAPTPNPYHYRLKQRLELLYFNQHQIASDWSFPEGYGNCQEFDTKPIEKQAFTVLPGLIDGKEYRTTNGDWDILMRPVLASKPACLGCHTDAKPGSTLGVMVYAVRRTPRK